MKVSELMAELEKYPGDMEVVVPVELTGDLDVPAIDSALDFYPTRPGRRRSWCWTDDPVGKGHDGREVLVIY